MKRTILMMAIVLALGISAQAAIFNGNPLEIHEVNILEDGLHSSNLPK